MKIKCGLILAVMLSTSVIAQDNNNASAPAALPPPATPPEATPAIQPPNNTPPEASTTTTAPAKAKKVHKPRKKKVAASSTKTAEANSPAPLVTNAPATVIVKTVNVRGQAHINSEVVGHLKKGDVVTVLELVTLKHPHQDEPANWARISMPGDIHAWINSSFIDPSNQTVKARKLNIRSGPGENYSVIGLLHKGDSVKPGETKGDWTAIEPPTNTYAFVAAHLLAPKAVETAPPAFVPPQPATQIAMLPQPTQITPANGEAPGGNQPLPVPPPPVAPAPAAAAQPQAEEQPLPKRVIEREGVVGGTFSIQAPSHYELHSLDDGHVMDYLYTTSTNVALARYKGLTVLVQGEEELDERWPNTPVLTIQRIQVVK